jgi:hypothetical protein
MRRGYQAGNVLIQHDDLPMQELVVARDVCRLRDQWQRRELAGFSGPRWRVRVRGDPQGGN